MPHSGRRHSWSMQFHTEGPWKRLPESRSLPSGSLAFSTFPKAPVIIALEMSLMTPVRCALYHSRGSVTNVGQPQACKGTLFVFPNIVPSLLLCPASAKFPYSFTAPPLNRVIAFFIVCFVVSSKIGYSNSIFGILIIPLRIGQH